MDINKQTHPALWQLLHNDLPFSNYDGVPTGCSDCPFASDGCDVNPSDPDEGYYKCSLIDAEDLWGEDPICKLDDWRKKARMELGLSEKAEP
jgi:hypothetical protein